MLSCKQDLVNFGEAHPSIFCYFNNFSKLYATFKNFNYMWLSYCTTWKVNSVIFILGIMVNFYWWDMSIFVSAPGILKNRMRGGCGNYIILHHVDDFIIDFILWH